MTAPTVNQPTKMKKWHWFLIFVLVGYFSTGLVQIQPEERGVVRRFGKIVAHPGPGLWIGWPYGIDRVDRIRVASVQRTHVGYFPEELDSNPVGQLLTGDQNLVNLQVAVDYSVGKETRDWERFLVHQNQVEAIIQQTTMAILSHWTSTKNIDDILLRGNLEIPAALTVQLQQVLAAQELGIEILQSSVVYLAPPEEVRSAFDAVNQAQTQARAIEQRAEEEAARRRQEAFSQADQLEQQATANATNVVTIANAEAARFEARRVRYQELLVKNPQILESIWWDEMGRTWAAFQKNGKVDLLDNYLGPDGLDLLQFAPGKK
ncbi:MAG: SPFH domain-containing protein [Zavarzinella sp.]